jgi:thiol-disulfide isomerase/thioredoxin
MKRLITLTAVVAAVGLTACTETKYVQPDAGEQSDAALQQDAVPPCGPDTYPCPPYGNVVNTVMEDLTFTGWIDENGNGDLEDEAYREWGLDYYYQLALHGSAKFLLLNVSAGWCSVCRAETKTLPQLQTDYKDKGIVLAQIIFENNDQNPADKAFVTDWRNAYNLNFSLGLDASFKTGRYFDRAATPANFVIALKNMTCSGSAVQAMQMLELMPGYSETDLRAYLDSLASNCQ